VRHLLGLCGRAAQSVGDRLLEMRPEDLDVEALYQGSMKRRVLP